VADCCVRNSAREATSPSSSGGIRRVYIYARVGRNHTTRRADDPHGPGILQLFDWKTSAGRAGGIMAMRGALLTIQGSNGPTIAHHLVRFVARLPTTTLPQPTADRAATTNGDRSYSINEGCPHRHSTWANFRKFAVSPAPRPWSGDAARARPTTFPFYSAFFSGGLGPRVDGELFATATAPTSTNLMAQVRG